MKHWLLATRPKTLAAGIIPVLVGSSLGAAVASFNLLIALACLMGALGIQIGCNFANDAIDALKGTDNDQRIGPTRAVASGLISARSMLTACFLVLAISFCIGLYLSSIGGWPILVLGIISILCAYGYTGGPFPLAYVGLGDLFVFLFFGLFAVLGSGYMQIAAADITLGDGILGLPISWWLIASAIGLQACAIIAVNNLRDRHGDAESGKRTMAVRLGRRGSIIYIFLIHLCAAAALTATAFYFHDNTMYIPAALAITGGIALSIGIARNDGPALNKFLGMSAGLECICGLSIVILMA